MQLLKDVQDASKIALNDLEAAAHAAGNFIKNELDTADRTIGELHALIRDQNDRIKQLTAMFDSLTPAPVVFKDAEAPKSHPTT